MKCETIQHLFTEILLYPERYESELKHISGCKNCRDEFDFFKLMKTSLNNNFEPLSSEESTKNQSEIFNKLKKNTFRTLQKYIIPAAAILVLLFGSLFNLNTNDTIELVSDDQWLLVTEYYGDMMTDMNDEAVLDYLIASDDIENLEELLITIN